MVSRNVNKCQSVAMGIGEPQKFERLLPVFLVGVIQNIATWYHVALLAKRKPTLGCNQLSN
ncbi:hypothetical protein DOU32_14355 (plasmid) [Enterococcus faecalis]|nr:hypothetical protein DOU32_14355 [Enterococcus faecalis]